MATNPPHDTVEGNHWLLLAMPQANAELRNDHFNAMLCPRGTETCVVEMVRGWLAAADTWGRYTGVSVGSNGPGGMFEEWLAVGQSLRRLLTRLQDLTELAEELGEDRCRLNFATLDRMVVAAMEWQELEA